jgi:hypothetical protein
MKNIKVKGHYASRHVYVDGLPLDASESLKMSNHSPSGFNWGYGGSGPAQLALALMLELGFDGKTAFLNYQDFKRKFITTLPECDFEMTLDATEHYILVNGYSVFEVIYDLLPGYRVFPLNLKRR